MSDYSLKKFYLKNGDGISYLSTSVVNPQLAAGTGLSTIFDCQWMREANQGDELRYEVSSYFPDVQEHNISLAVRLSVKDATSYSVTAGYYVDDTFVSLLAFFGTYDPQKVYEGPAICLIEYPEGHLSLRSFGITEPESSEWEMVKRIEPNRPGYIQTTRPAYTGTLDPGSQSAYHLIIAGAPVVRPTDPYVDIDGESKGDSIGGDGDADWESFEISIPGDPTLSGTDSGFITVFNPSAAELRSLASYMWSDLFSLSTFKKLFADPMDCILGLSIVPVNVPGGTKKEVKVGNISTGISMTTAASRYVTVDCGSIQISEHWGSNLDYSPYTKMEVYLPFCGIHAVNIDDFMKTAMHIVYKVDIITGACCCMLSSQYEGVDHVLYSYVGQCSAGLPVTGVDYSSIVRSAVSAAGTIGTLAASGGTPAGMIGAASSIAGNVISSKPNVEKSGTMPGTGGMLGVKNPYIIITRPQQCIPGRQNEFMGYPSFTTKTLSTISGFNVISDIHLENIPATDAEMDEIDTLLKEGVIF